MWPSNDKKQGDVQRQRQNDDHNQELSSFSTGEQAMLSFSPELTAVMRAALDDVMTHVPVAQSTSIIKIRLAEFILKAAEKGHTSYDVLFVAAFSQIGAVLLMAA